MTNTLTYWLNRLDVMSRAQCVELTAQEAGELRGLLVDLESESELERYCRQHPVAEIGAYGPVTPESPLLEETKPLPLDGLGRAAAVARETLAANPDLNAGVMRCEAPGCDRPAQFANGAKVLVCDAHAKETEAERAGRLMVEAAQNR